MARDTHKYYFFNRLKLIFELSLTQKDKDVPLGERPVAHHVLLRSPAKLHRYVALGNQRTNRALCSLHRGG